ncbi:annexin A13 [Microplitis demolitor]|uniref:annexin A13 n=1 Tax=Microplitis demolitor TaxID=69319 RepID=UPI0004CCB987|nr:annexin A13 [Microplitis demolitor]
MYRLMTLTIISIISGLFIFRPVHCKNPFKQDAIAIHFALVKDFSVNESTIINIVTQRTTDQLQQISQAYESRYGEKLLNDIRYYLTGKFEEIMISLFMDDTDFYAEELYNELRGFKDDEKVFIDILLTQNHMKLQEIKDVYTKNYLNSLEHDFQKFTTKNSKKLYLTLLQCERNETMDINYIRAEYDARQLYHAAISQSSEVNPDVFINILTSVSYDQLRHTVMKFFDIFGEHIETVIEKNFTGDFARALIAIVEYAKSRDGFIANRLYDSLEYDFDHRSLIRLIIISKNIGIHSIREAIQIRHRIALEYFLNQTPYGGFRNTLLTFLFPNFTTS